MYIIYGHVRAFLVSSDLLFRCTRVLKLALLVVVNFKTQLFLTFLNLIVEAPTKHSENHFLMTKLLQSTLDFVGLK